MTIKGASLLEAIKVPPSPFPGLRPFEFHESHLFFGRDGQVEKLVAKLTGTRFLAVVGTSGSGKSSLVRAGLMPALRGGMMASAGPKWRIAVMRPGNDPIASLAVALNRPDVFGSDDPENAAIQIFVAEATLRRGSRGLVEAARQTGMPEHENLLVIVDQFEELFRFAREASRRTRDESDRYQNDAAAFIKLLLEARGQREVNIFVVLTMRSDFLGDCAQFWDLPEAINESQYLIPRLTRDQLREVITGPVALGGGEITHRLATQLLNDIGDNQDQLPVLQHLLMRVWDERKHRRIGPHKNIHQGDAIHLCCYEAVGGMAEALSRHADEAYNELPDERHRQIAEKMFKALTEKGEDNREVRRPVMLGEIRAVAEASAAEVTNVIETFRLPGRSFLMPPAATPLDDDSLIDISHESLIRGWQRLREWVDEEARSARVYRRLAETAALYDKREAGLWRDPDLQLALIWRGENKPSDAWAERYHPGLGQAMSFLDQSVAARDAERQENERARKREIKRARRTAFIFGLAFIMTLAALIFAFNKAADARAALNEARIQKDAALGESEKAVKSEAAARSAERDALAQKQSAEDRKKEAEKANKIAQEQTLIAERQRVVAESNAKRAEEHEAKTRELYYVANMGLAQQAYDAGDMSRVNELLRAHLPGANAAEQDDLRSFYWYYLWRNTDKKLAALKGHAGDVTSVAFSSDGKTLASGSGENFVTLWDVRSEHEVATLKGHAGDVSAVAFSPDGKTLASGSRDKTVKLWDVRSRQEIATLKGHAGDVISVAFSSDGKTLASGGLLDKTVKLWDVHTGQELATLKGHLGDVTAVAFSPDSKTLASGSSDNTVKLWDVRNGEEISTLKGHMGDATSVAFSSDGKTLASGSSDNTVKLWDMRTEQEVATFKGHGSTVTSVAFSSDDKRLASLSRDNTVKLWDLRSGQELETFKGDAYSVRLLALSSDGKTLASVRRPDDSVSDGVAPISARPRPDDIVELWDLSRQDVATLKGHAGVVMSVAFSPDGETLASGSGDNTVKVWDVRSGREVATLKGHADFVESVAFSPDGKTLASGSFDDTVRLWDVRSGQEASTLKGHAYPPVAFSPDGKTLASGTKDKTVKLWDVHSGQEVATFKGHTGLMGSLAFSPDGKTLAIRGGDNTVKLWDVRSGQEVATLKGHASDVRSVVFSSDGKTLATGSFDDTVKLWDVRTGQEVATLKGHAGDVTSVAFSPDGKTLASGSVDRTVKLWFAATDQEVMAKRNR